MALRDKTVLVLGAGINGVAITRELLLNGMPVCLVDRGDIAGGTTAYSSRLIHGGLRYLEYGEFQLVRESLEERERLLRLAPQFVRPLHLYIPIQHRERPLFRRPQIPGLVRRWPGQVRAARLVARVAGAASLRLVRATLVVASSPSPSPQRPVGPIC